MTALLWLYSLTRPYSSRPSYPGKQGTPACWANRLAAALLPNKRIDAGLGPTQIKPASITA